MERENRPAREIEEATPDETSGTAVDESSPLLPIRPEVRMVRTKVPEIEVHIYRQGNGPIDVFKSSLVGWDQDQLDVRDILDKYSFKSIFAFNRDNGRGARVRVDPKSGRSVLRYFDGVVIHIDGEPKESLIKPITKILVGIAVTSFMIVVVVTESPGLMNKFNLSGARIPPWILACVVILFTRLRKQTSDILKRSPW
ncbi:hypothetical protein NMG60_11031506 [Bertholletia excelsa]